MATSNNIVNALTILNSFDWWWSLECDGSYFTTKNQMKAKMREFVALASKCEAAVCNALRELWEATYKFAHKDWVCSSSTLEDKAEYEAKKSELMSIILPMAA